MPNTLTGNYDVVVQVSLAAVNRFLAVMHEAQRFVHSLSGHLNDAPTPPGPQQPAIVLTAVADLFGKAVPNQRQIPRRPFADVVPASEVFSIIHPPIVNAGGGILHPPKFIPSNLAGSVQLQISPPSVDVPDPSGTNCGVPK